MSTTIPANLIAGDDRSEVSSSSCSMRLNQSTSAVPHRAAPATREERVFQRNRPDPDISATAASRSMECIKTATNQRPPRDWTSARKAISISCPANASAETPIRLLATCGTFERLPASRTFTRSPLHSIGPSRTISDTWIKLSTFRNQCRLVAVHY